MIIRKFTLGKIIPTNTYFYVDEKTNVGVVIDPADNGEFLLQEIEKNKWNIEKILLTHGHFDHIGAVQLLHDKLNIPYFIHKNGKQYLENPEYNLSLLFEPKISLFDADYLNDNDIISVQNSNFNLKVIHTPGHTSDSCVYYDEVEKVAFVGDTIFLHSRGRTDVPGGNEFLLNESIKNKIFTLPENTLLYSGHTPPTTVAAEKKYNLI